MRETFPAFPVSRLMGHPVDDSTFAEKLLATLRVVLKRTGVCPECTMCVGASGQHGVSQVFHGERCHLGALLDEADNAGL